MKILVVSDTHGEHELLEEVVAKEKPDLLYHLGDAQGYEDYIEAVCGCPIEIVRGNCDYYSELPSEVLLRVGKKLVLMTHGHLFDANYGNYGLVQVAKERKADVVLFGHTHCPELVEEDGVLLFNPGSISFPRQSGSVPSYGVIEVDGNGQLFFSHKYMD